MNQVFERTTLLLRCLVHILLHGPARRPLNGSARRVAVFQTSKLGDMVCTTPVFRALKNSIPGVSVTVVGNSVNGVLLEGHPDVDEYIVFRRDRQGTMRQLLRDGAYDAAVMTSQNFVGLACLILSGIPRIVSFHVGDADSPNETLAYRILSKFIHTITVSAFVYAPGEYLKLLKPLGILTADTTKHLTLSEKGEAQAIHLLPLGTSPLVGIAPGAGSKIKEWPVDRFAALADHIIDSYGATIVLIGGPDDTELAQAMHAQMKRQGSVIDTVGSDGVNVLKSIVARLKLLVAADTGPIYIAEAFGVPTVDIVGPVDERVQPPRGPRNLVVVPKRERAQLFVMTARVFDFAETRRQAELTTVDMVVSAVGQLWSVL